jgi:gliding motility-associated-like protein
MHTLKRIQLICRKYLSILFLFLCLSHYSAIGQVVADFSADDTIGCDQLTVHFQNEGSTGANYSFIWYFGVLGTSTDENPVFTFVPHGIYPVKLVVTNTNTSEKDSITKNITVILTPSANLAIDSTNACIHGKVEFQAGFSAKDYALWDFGDGTSIQSLSSYMFHVYNAYDTYPVTYIASYQGCSDTSQYLIRVDGPKAEITVDPEETCKGNPVAFTMVNDSDVMSHSWNLGEGDIQTGNPVNHTYYSMGYISVYLTISGLSGTCTIEDTVHIYEVVASFTYSEKRCNQQRVFFINTSTDKTNSYWNFGNGSTSATQDGSAVYSTGSYNVTLWIENPAGCADSITQEVVIYPPPDLQMQDDFVICPGQPAELSAVGGDSIAWFPPEAFDDPHSFTPTAYPDSTTIYVATITDTITHCSNSGDVEVLVQGGFIPDKISVFPTDTSLIIGDTVSITIYDTLDRYLTYIWTPETGISCTDCSNPTLQPLQTTTYTLVISDTNQCFMSESFDINIEVKEEYRLGVPEAFTPNGDQINDIIKVNGWGIKQLIEFRIFNRWGTEVFFTDDINQGWDGYYKDRLQNIDTYSFVIKAEMWDDNVTTVKGTFSLLR